MMFEAIGLIIFWIVAFYAALFVLGFVYSVLVHIYVYCTVDWSQDDEVR